MRQGFDFQGVVLTFPAAQGIGSHCLLLCGNDVPAGFAAKQAKPRLANG